MLTVKENIIEIGNIKRALERPLQNNQEALERLRTAIRSLVYIVEDQLRRESEVSERRTV